MKNLISLSPYLLIVAAVVFLLGMWAGYDWRSTIAEADQANAVKFALDKQEKDAAVSRAEEIALIKSQQKTKIVYRSIKKEVPKYVSIKQKTDSDCNISIGIKRMFKHAATEQLPDTAAIDVARDKKPSDITEERLINYSLDNIDRYNQVKNQCNSLLRWHENIIKNKSEKGS